VTKSLVSIGRLSTYAALAILMFSMAIPQASAEDKHVALEVVAGRLKPGVSKEDHLRADKAVAAMVSKLPGFISRETGEGPAGDWFAIVHWATLRDAENAGAIFMKSEEGKVSSGMLDPNSILFKHYVTE
jgi:hypothetical protein